MTRPDIANAVNLLGRKLSCPTQEDVKHVHTLIGYSQGTKDCYLELRGHDMTTMRVFAAADWAGDETDRKSTSGHITFLGEAPIQWNSKKQGCIARSTMEAEYVALAGAESEAVHLKQLIGRILEVQVPVKMFCDNMAAEALAKGEINIPTYNLHQRLRIVRSHQDIR